jgi:hypothetical protein
MMRTPEQLYEELRKLNWQEPVPDDLQSEIRMAFNEALAGGPNMNGDAGPTLSINHAIDCVWATERIDALVLALGPFALLAGGDVNMNDPLHKWFTVGQLRSAKAQLGNK